MKLLLVEDEKDLLNAYQKGLKAEGYGIDAAASAEDALDLLSYNQYDCIVLDLNLPKMSGMKLLEKIREQDDQVKIMIVSALHTVDHRIEGLDKGAND
ncbi:MAG: response regulator, partial [Ignavibacteria bacterium]|nr:response regulator [Ignavibacteria bacterium]